MKKKRVTDLVGASTESMNDALKNALAGINDPKDDYEVLEALSNNTKGKKNYQITLKVNLANRAS